MTALVTARPSCWNKPRPAADATYVAQAGWKEERRYLADKPERSPVLVDIKSQFGNIPCQVGKHAPYPCCTGCQHNTKGA